MRWKLPEDEELVLIENRRHLHTYPELSWQEEKTSQFIRHSLQKLGLEPKMGIAKTGLYVDIGSGDPKVALRADMDALPIHEETTLAFSSKVSGVMHACGHDAHTACLLAVAKRLVDLPPKNGAVRLIFQPAEELASGAAVMIEEGVIEASSLQAIYGIHFWSRMRTGAVSIVEGSVMGSVDKFEIEVQGRAGHGALPHQTADALVAGAALVSSLQTLVSRRVDPLVPVVVTVGQFESGSAFNIIPGKARLVGTIRTLNQGVWEEIPSLLEELVTNTVRAYGCSAVVDLQRLLRPLKNHPKAVRCIQKAAAEWIEPDDFEIFRTLAGEDFSDYLFHLPGAFAFVGAGGKQNAEQQPPHHNSKFWLDEDAFALGVRLLEGAARRTLTG